TAVHLDGCVDGWSWCDVSAGGQRGWVYGPFLQQEYEGERLSIHDGGARIGIPIISFEFGSYWNDHYRDRSWYRQRDHWSRYRPQYRVQDEHRGGQEHTHGDSYHVPPDDARGSGHDHENAVRSDGQGDGSHPYHPADGRLSDGSVMERRSQDDARAAARTNEPSMQTRIRGDSPAQHNRTANAPVNPRSASERKAQWNVRNDDTGAGAHPPAPATNPAVRTAPVAPAQNNAAEHRAADTAAKARELERDDKDRH
ncbi:MAG TPA: hypothetical protein VF132_03670, partial [Rudaea sp.]